MVTREALLFYRDGQVKFTHRAVEHKQYGYRESFSHAVMLEYVPENAPFCSTITYREFRFRGDVARYRIFEEVD